jgi:ferritin-like metal-binding protein YciE
LPEAQLLDRWLIALHAVEQQALFQLRRAARLAGDPRLGEQIAAHARETEGHREALRRCLSARGRRPSRWRDVGATLNRAGFLTYTAASPHGPIRLFADLFAYEHLEIPAYRMLAAAAARRGDAAVQATAVRILGEEEAMATRLADDIDLVVAADLRAARIDPARRLAIHLRDVDALETQARSLFGAAARVAGSPELRTFYAQRAAASRSQRREIDTLLVDRGAAAAPLKRWTMGLAGLLWAIVWAVQRDTPAKLCCFAHAAIHLEIAAYRILHREAQLLDDAPVATLAARLAEEEQRAGARAGALVLHAADCCLAPNGIRAGTSQLGIGKV